MHPTLRHGPVLTSVSMLLLHGSALAINGAQPGGNGIKNASMGGASIALPLDAVAAANNPAGMAFVPASVVAGVQTFRGDSSAQYVVPGNHLANSQTIAAPEFGISWPVNPAVTLGFSVAGGGSGSDYRQAALPVPGAGIAKSSLRIAEFSPSVAWKLRDDLSLGFALRLVRQQFEAEGVVVPAPVPGGLLPLPGHGEQTSTGVGWRVGLLWKPAPEWSIGVDAKPRTRMGKLDGYDQDILAYSDGRIDVPAQYGLGVAWQATDRLTLAADWLRILWGDIKINQDPNGFGWRNQPVLRLGAAWKLDDRITLRTGLSRNRAQIGSDRTAQNLLVPAINNKAYSAGLSWQVDRRVEINLGYELNPRTTLNGTGASTGTSLTSKVQMFMLGGQYAF